MRPNSPENLIDALCQTISEAIPTQADNKSHIAAMLLGLQQFVITFNGIVAMQTPVTQKDDRIERGLQAMLELYGRVEQMQSDKSKAVTSANNIRPILRDIA